MSSAMHTVHGAGAAAQAASVKLRLKLYFPSVLHFQFKSILPTRVVVNSCTVVVGLRQSLVFLKCQISALTVPSNDHFQMFDIHDVCKQPTLTAVCEGIAATISG